MLWELADLSFLMFFSGLAACIVAFRRSRKMHRESIATFAELVALDVPEALLEALARMQHHLFFDIYGEARSLKRLRTVGVILIMASVALGGPVLEIYTNLH